MRVAASANSVAPAIRDIALLRTVLGIVGRDGAHAEFLQLPPKIFCPFPTNIPDEHAVFTEPLAAACGILERVSIARSDRVAVIGDGKLGLLCAQVVALTGASVLLIGKHSSKLRIAERRGIETATPKEAAKRKRQFDVVVEASGAASRFRAGARSASSKGPTGSEVDFSRKNGTGRRADRGR